MIFGVDTRIVDENGKELPHDGKAFGDLQVRGPWIVNGYFKGEGGDPLRKDAAGASWFPTGDVVTIDPDGYMQITDRSKDVIKSGGEWISSIDLENVAVAHPAVQEAAVIGIRHPKWDERPILVVVKKAGQEVSKAELLKFYEGKIAKWWMPDDVVFVTELPHTATGKLSKLTLRQQMKDYKLPANERTSTSTVDGPRAAHRDRARRTRRTRSRRTCTARCSQALAAADADAQVRAILIHGTRDCFTAGNDLKDFLDSAAAIRAARRRSSSSSALPKVAKPLIAAVGGPAVGVGTTMLLHCDLVYAAPGARFQMPFVPLGLVPEAASSLLLPMIAGYQRAAELLLLGQPFGAEKALAAGFVTEIVPEDELLEHARAAARRGGRAAARVGAPHQAAHEAPARRRRSPRRWRRKAASSPSACSRARRRRR